MSYSSVLVFLVLLGVLWQREMERFGVELAPLLKLDKMSSLIYDSPDIV